VRAAVAHGDVAGDVALRLKYERWTGLARTMASIMAQQVDAAGIFAPVPLHRWRLWSRGFNQATLVGRTVAAASRLKLTIDVRVRRQATRRYADFLSSAGPMRCAAYAVRPLGPSARWPGWSTTSTPAAQRPTPVRQR